ncbi:DUF2511 domain-containing protein [Flavobacterium sp. UBA7663]|uniref:DUF2511 domain-containing protein n=1 Tax=Flavobacterium sp. UBA7663 TaxID=1946557 RepID=UPI0025BD7B48|nr:DUF2511 domain-containing protein [Flavobacterium sp. UBA7663]
MKKFYLLSILTLLISCSKNENVLRFSKQDYGKEWPFSVDEIEVYCSGYKEIYCKTNDGKIYALNGSAKGASRDNPTINKVEEIWLDNPEFEGLKIPYAQFITEGLKLCDDK